MSDLRAHMWARRLLLVLAVTFVLEAPFLAYDLYKTVSHASIYEKLVLDLPRDQAIRLLQRQQVRCGVTAALDGPGQPDTNVCRFSDFWRDYTVVIDPATNRISARQYSDRKRPWMWRWRFAPNVRL